MGIEERKRRERQLRHDSILEAAKKVFAAKGFKGATVEQIAYEAEVSPGTVYLYFKNKEELHTLLCIEILKKLNSGIIKIQTCQKCTPKDKLLSIKNFFITIYKDEPKLLIHLFHLQSGDQLKNLSKEILSTIKQISSVSLKALGAIIQDGMNQGHFTTLHPVAVADIIWSNYSGVVLWVDSKRMLDDQKDFVTQTLEISFKIIISGLKPDQPT